MMSLVSVIIPIYKVEKYLNECIESVVNQTYKNLEIILVDDGSPDQCPQICEEWKLKDERIKVIHKMNGGLSDARNAGLQIAQGEYIGFVDSDDWIAPDMYEKLLYRIQKENADICACGIMNFSNGRQEALKVCEIVGDSEKILAMIYKNTDYPVAACNKLYKHKCWDDFEFPKGKICEDAFTTYLLVDRAERIVQITDPLYFYRIRENSIMTSAFDRKRMEEEEAWRCNYEYMKEHYPQIYPSAFSFYLQKVNMLIHTISEQDRKKYHREYQYLYQTLKKNFVFLILKSGLPIKYRIKFVIDFIHL